MAETGQDARPIIGLSSATSSDHNTSDAFSFWLAPGVIVNPFDIVEAEQMAPQGTSRTFGIVTVLTYSTDAPRIFPTSSPMTSGRLRQAPTRRGRAPRWPAPPSSPTTGTSTCR